MAQEIDKETVRRCVEYIQQEPSYNIVDFLKEHNLFIRAEENMDGYKIKCPYHPDKKPSLSINIYTNQCNCLACNNGGGFIKYTLKILNDVLGRKMNFYSYINTLLQSDPRMRIAAQSHTVFKDRNMTLEEMSKVAINRVRPDRKKGKNAVTMEDLHHRMKVDKLDSLPYIKMAILTLQGKNTPAVVYQTLVESKENIERTESFKEIKSFEDLDIDFDF